VSLPSLAYLMLSNRPALHSIGYQYPAVLIPWWFLAAVCGLARLERWSRRRARARLRWLFLCLLLIGSVGMNLVLNPARFHARNGAFRPTSHHELTVEAMALIPPDAGVATINVLGPHLTHRRYLISVDKYPVPAREDHMRHVDYVLLDLVDCRAVGALGRPRYTELIQGILQTGQFRIRYWSGRIVLLERGEVTEQDLAPLVEYVTELDHQNRPCWP
jgi:hypothetical protein